VVIAERRADTGRKWGRDAHRPRVRRRHGAETHPPPTGGPEPTITGPGGRGDRRRRRGPRGRSRPGDGAAPIVAIAFYDEEAGHPRPAARTESAAELAENGTLFPADADLPWQVFVHQTEIVSADLTDVDGDASETPLWSGAIFPLGDHGVLVVGSRRPDAFSGTDVSLASMLVATTRSALDRVARERTLRKHTNSLEEKNAVLERLQRTNDTIRGITTELIRASTRAEVIQAVCAELTSADVYSFAWIGTRDAVTEEVVPDAAWPRTDAERRGHGGLELTVPTEVVRTDSPDRCHSD
jgi:hypothetical protein